MHAKLALATVLLGLAACSRDEDARKLLSDMATLQESVQAALRDSPDEAGIAKAEGLVAAQSDALHARWIDVSDGKLSPAVLTLLPTRCAANAGAAAVGEDYVKNALVGRRADDGTRRRLLARIDTLKTRLDAICKR